MLVSLMRRRYRRAYGLGDLPTVDVQQLIINEATKQGVPASIALAMAQTESGVAQWTPGGGLVTSTAGAIGIFQLLPSTAAGLGVDPADLGGNISGGISYLKQMFEKYGNWSDALAAYNWGPGNVSSGAAVPTSVGQYVSNVLSRAGSWAASLFGSGSSTAPDLSTVAVNAAGSPDLSAADIGSTVLGVNPAAIAGAAIIGIGLIAWVMRE